VITPLAGSLPHHGFRPEEAATKSDGVESAASENSILHSEFGILNYAIGD
jgi:hypothetical protein